MYVVLEPLFPRCLAEWLLHFMFPIRIIERVNKSIERMSILRADLSIFRIENTLGKYVSRSARAGLFLDRFYFRAQVATVLQPRAAALIILPKPFERDKALCDANAIKRITKGKERKTKKRKIKKNTNQPIKTWVDLCANWRWFFFPAEFNRCTLLWKRACYERTRQSRR